MPSRYQQHKKTRESETHLFSEAPQRFIFQSISKEACSE